MQSLNNFTRVIIETSAMCNLRCRMCPMLSYQGNRGIMEERIFSKIIEDLQSVAYIGLDGWGEPLLDPQLAKRIKKAKVKAEKVGFFTNATLLNTSIISDLKESGLDQINISFDGGSKAVYENIRIGANFDHVVRNIELLKESQFNVSLAFVMSTQNYHDLFNFLDLAHQLNITVVNLKPVDVVSTKESLKFMLPPQKIIELYNEADEYIRQYDLCIQLNSWNIFEEQKPKNNCLANPLDVIFINYLGDVSPCCNLGHPVPRLRKRILGQKKIENTFKSFGNVMDDNIYDIWESAEYCEFRSLIREKIRPSACNCCNLF